MYLFRMKDGSIVPAPEDFSPASPEWDKLKDVQDVLYISKIFEKQLRLVPRPVEERTSIRAQQKEILPASSDAPVEPKPSNSKRKNS